MFLVSPDNLPWQKLVFIHLQNLFIDERLKIIYLSFASDFRPHALVRYYQDL